DGQRVRVGGQHRRRCRRQGVRREMKRPRAKGGSLTMMKRTSWMSAALTALGVLTISGVASASSHREAPAIANDPAADNTDLYAWVEGTNLIVLANYIPLEEPAGGPNFHSFSDDVLYEIHIARGGSSLDDALTYQIDFSTTYPNYVAPDSNTP